MLRTIPSEILRAVLCTGCGEFVVRSLRQLRRGLCPAVLAYAKEEMDGAMLLA